MNVIQKKYIYGGIGIISGVFLFFAGALWGFNAQLRAETTQKLFGDSNVVPENVDFSLLLKAWHLIDEKYVFAEKPTNQERLWGSIAGLVDSIGDPYTTFFPPKAAKIFSQDIEGNFGGIGVELGEQEGILTVIAPLKNSPAYKAGIRAGDKIIEVNGTSTAQMNIDDALLLIRGKIGESVALKIFREDAKATNGGKAIDFTIIRSAIEIPTLETKKEGDVFIISLFNFNAQAGPLFERALREFQKTGGNKLIIDVRGNPGGYLDASVDMASFFIPAGKTIVTEDFGGKQNPTIHKSKGFFFFNSPPRVIVLVDGGSASASEIFAAALQEEAGAKLVGTKTYGKGSVQELVPLTGDTFVKITVAQWLTPKGVSISKNGITPDYVVSVTEKEISAGKDPQLAKALSLLNAK